MRIKDIAEKYRKLFIQDKRENGEYFYAIKTELYNTTEYSEISDVIQQLKEDLDEDSVYKYVVNCLNWIIDTDPEDCDELYDILPEEVENRIDVYIDGLTNWLNKSVKNVDYLTKALEEGFDIKDGSELLSMAQYLAIEDVYRAVINFICKKAEAEAAEAAEAEEAAEEEIE